MTRTADTIAALPAETRQRILNHVGSPGTREFPDGAPADLVKLTVGDIAAVLAFGAWRSGVVIKKTPTRVHIAYTTPSSRGRIYIATETHPRVGQYHPAAATA